MRSRLPVDGTYNFLADWGCLCFEFVYWATQEGSRGAKGFS